MAQPIVELFDAAAVKDRQILLLESIWSLWSTGEWILALVIGVCALLLPILKFLLLYLEHAKSSIRVPVKLRDMISKLAMAEVFLIALILVVIKEMPGGTEGAVGCRVLLVPHLRWSSQFLFKCILSGKSRVIRVFLKIES
jgi:uncharacterized paraquat-inducible protein A